MEDIFQDIIDWDEQNFPFAIATVVGTWRSAPRKMGASMLVGSDQQMIGSVSGGCVEGQVVKVAQEVIRSGQSQLLTFGVSNDDAWEVGLSCGGEVQVFVQPFFKQRGEKDAVWDKLKAHIDADRHCMLIYGKEELFFYSAEDPLEDIDPEILAAAESYFREKKSGLATIGDNQLFFHDFAPKNKLLVIGAAHVSLDLAYLAKQQHFNVTIVDPRGLFYDSLRGVLPEENLIRAWPADVLPSIELDDSVYAVLLTHDPKIDDQALHILLKSDVKYIGALGSRKTQAKRRTRLLDAGFSEEHISRIHGPVGLDINAGTPAEIALSIMAEIIKIKNQSN